MSVARFLFLGKKIHQHILEFNQQLMHEFFFSPFLPSGSLKRKT
jgi:hypothetical protein